MANAPTPPKNQTLMSKDRQRPEIERLGLADRGLKDLYHRLLEITWTRLLVAVVVSYLVANTSFALVYLLVGGIENARPGSFGDVFFFSVQTMATIGYGKLVPVSVAANLLVTLESLLGLLGFALITGLIFAKFARPTAAVRFSQALVISRFEGQPALMLRIANERTSQIVEAQLRLVLLKSSVTVDGQPIRRMLDLSLLRSQNAFFALTWLVVHPIDERSPLHGMSAADLAASDLGLAASLTGLEEISGQTVHARRWYSAQDIQWDMRFVDILGRSESGGGVIDYGKFDDVEPAGDTLAALPSTQPFSAVKSTPSP